MVDSKIKLAIVGVGKIVKDQHHPSISKNPDYELVATASRNGSLDGIESFKSIESLLTSRNDLDAVSLCMPPQYRFNAAKFALEHGVDVLLEKPPGATVCEVNQLEKLAVKNNCQLYTTWHSRHAPAVASAKHFLSQSQLKIEEVFINWKEDVRKWHPNQEWIWQAGGLGVFDPGINGLSILTHILPVSFFVEKSTLKFPENKAAPIAANLIFTSEDGYKIIGEFDWDISGGEEWNIEVLTDQGKLVMSSGGAELVIDGEPREVEQHSEHGEYESIYREFSSLVLNRKSNVDVSPLALVADAFLLGDRVIVESFDE